MSESGYNVPSPDLPWRRAAELQNDNEFGLLEKLKSLRDALDEMLDGVSIGCREGGSLPAKSQVRCLEIY